MMAAEATSSSSAMGSEAPSGEALRPDARWMRVVVLALGFAVIDLWCDTLGHAAAMGAASGMVQDAFTNGRVFWNLALVACCAAMVARPMAMERAQRLLDVAAPILACACTVVYARLGAASWGSPGAGVAVILLAGASYGWMEVRLLAETVRIERFAVVAWAIVASRVAKTLAVPLLGLAGDATTVVVDAVLPLLVLGALVGLRKGESLPIAKAAEAPRISLRETDQVLVLALLVVCPVANAVARSMSNLGFWGAANLIDASSIAMALLSSLVFCALAAAVFARCPDSEEIVRRFELAIIVLMGCILLFGEQTLSRFAAPALLTGTLSGASELFSHFLFWLSAVAAIRMVDRHPYRLAALTELCMSAAAVLFGLLLQAVPDLGGFIVETLLYALMVCAIAFSFRLRGEAASVPAPPEDPQDACARIAASHNLTPRETDVFLLLAQGRSRTFIQDELCLSDSTIKTYTNHIYRKLGVHSKQDLITMTRS